MEKTYRYGGEKRTKRVLAVAEKKPVSFEKIAKGTNDYFWYRRKVSEGKGYDSQAEGNAAPSP